MSVLGSSYYGLHLPSKSIPDLTNRIIRPEAWQCCEAGGFGDVFRCRYTGDGDGAKEVAVKALRFNFSVDENKNDAGKVARMIRRELGIWRRLDHRNIVPFLGIAHGFGRQGSAALVSLWMPNGTMHTFLEAYDERLEVAHRLQLLSDIANGLQYLHSFPMVHGDLSSNNVLLDHKYTACLTDFGCASLLGELPEAFAYLKMSTMRPGTLRWAAPEYFSFDEDETKHTIKSDIYSFGNMALLILSGKYPWSEVRADTAVMLRLSQGLKPSRPPSRPINDQHWALIERCWSSIPERPLAEKVVSLLQQLLDTCHPQPPLCEFLGNPISSASILDHRGDTDSASHGIPSEGVCSSTEETSEARHPPGESTGQKHDRNSEGTVLSLDKRMTNLGLAGQPLTFEWVRGDLLGKGTYGRVYLGLNTSTGDMIAIKQVKKSDKNARHLNFVHELNMERQILNGLNHPHVIGYLGAEETSTILSIFLEYVPGGSIASCLRQHGRFDEEVIRSFTTQIFDGLVYLHAKNIIHRNVEANNILVEASGVCKLSGFGNALRVGDNHTSRVPRRGIVFWTAPEVTEEGQGRKCYGPKIDVWSAGCVLLKMWTGGRFWRDGDVFALMVKSTSQGTSLPIPTDAILSESAIEFSKRCFVVDPEARASAAELLQHRYLRIDPDWEFTGFK